MLVVSPARGLVLVYAGNLCPAHGDAITALKTGPYQRALLLSRIGSLGAVLGSGVSVALSVMQEFILARATLFATRQPLIFGWPSARFGWLALSLSLGVAGSPQARPTRRNTWRGAQFSSNTSPRSPCSGLMIPLLGGSVPAVPCT